MRDPVFLVTGAADGLGLQLVARLAADGRRVLATDLDNHRLEEAARLSAWPSDLVRLAPLDVRQPRDWSDAFALGRRAFGGIDVLVHATVPLRASDLQRAETDDGITQALQAATQHMLPRCTQAPRRGQVVVIAPGAAHQAARARCRTADAALRPQGLAVTAVCTSAIEALENGLALRATPACPVHAVRVSADRVVDAVLGRVLEGRPRQVFLPAYAGWVARLADLFPTLATRLRTRGAVLSKASASEAPAPAHRA